MAKSRASGAAAKTAAGASASSPDRPAYLAESEKAVKLFMTLDYFNFEKTKTYPVWIPKSQLADDGRPGEWITREKASDVADLSLGGSMFSSYRDAKGNTFGASMTARERENQQRRESRFAEGKRSYEELIQQAKKMGIKGVRSGMRRKTIEEKISRFSKKAE